MGRWVCCRSLNLPKPHLLPTPHIFPTPRILLPSSSRLTSSTPCNSTASLLCHGLHSQGNFSSIQYLARPFTLLLAPPFFFAAGPLLYPRCLPPNSPLHCQCSSPPPFLFIRGAIFRKHDPAIVVEITWTAVWAAAGPRLAGG